MRSRDQSRGREDAGEDDGAPALPPGEVEEGGDLFQVVGDGHGAGDDVEEDVPLGAEQHEGDGADAHAAAVPDEGEKKHREEGGGRNGGRDLCKGLRDPGELWLEAYGDAYRDGPGGGEQEGHVDAKEGGSGAFEDVDELIAADGAKKTEGMGGQGEDRDEEQEQKADPKDEGGGMLPTTFIPSGVGQTGLSSLSDGAVVMLFHALGGGAAEDLKDTRVLHKMKQGRVDAGFALGLLELKAVAPGDDRPPDELVGEDDDGDHGGEAPDDGMAVADGGGGLEIRAETRKAEVARAQDKHLAGHEEEPGTSDGHDGVPDKADGGVGEFQLKETLDAREAVDLGGFAELFGNAAKRGVEGEGHIPDGAGEDEQDSAELDADLAGGKEGDHGEHDPGQEAEDGDGLEDIERGEHEGFKTLAVGGDIAVADRKSQGQEIGEADADNGVKGVERKGARAEGDLDGRGGMAEPVMADADDAIEEGEADDGDEEIEHDGPSALEGLGAGEGFAGAHGGEAAAEVNH